MKRWYVNRPLVTFIGVNPSIADEEVGDNTFRVCINYAKRWGFGGLIIANLFGYVSTDVKKLINVNDPIGPENDHYILESCQESEMVIACWGTHGSLNHREVDVIGILSKAGQSKKIHALALTKNGYPHLPLYLSKDIKPFRFR